MKDPSVRFAKKYNTSSKTFWKIIELTEKTVSVIDIMSIISRKINISYGSLYYWCSIADKMERQLEKEFSLENAIDKVDAFEKVLTC